MHRSAKVLQHFYSDRTWSKPSEDTIYLTFDDGPCPILTEWILNILKVECVSATFFCVGENVLRYPEVFEKVVQDGHRIGNHLMKHENGFKTGVKRYYRSFLETHDLLNTPLFRPPYGRMKKCLDEKLKDKVEIVMWTWLAKDYDPDVAPEKILQAAEKIRPGDILVFHDNPKATVNLKATLQPIIQLLKQKGYVFATL